MANMINRWKKRPTLRLELVVLAFLFVTISFTYWTVLREKLCNLAPVSVDSSLPCTIDKDTLLKRLHLLHDSVKNSTNKNFQLQIKEIISVLGSTTETVLSRLTNDGSRGEPFFPEVCPEVWLGTRNGYPFYFQGWRQVNCSNVLPFEKVITILLYHPLKDNKTCPQNVRTVLAGLRKLYLNVQVIIGGMSHTCLSPNEALNVRVLDFEGNTSTPGVIWNKLIKLVATPYVLVGRELDGFIWTTNLERQVRVLSYNTSLSVAGGAVRNLTGHWRVGCFQTTMRNYILKYLEGYYASRNECMFCDYLAGPFVTRTKLVQAIQFDESLPVDILFEDWFWRLHQQAHVVVNCPDVMYLASDPLADSKFESRELWIPFVRKWELNRVVAPGGVTFSYTCLEAGISCKNVGWRTDSFLIPICCLEQYAYAFKIFNDLCLENNLRYELDTGSVVGAVKTKGMMPWDLDGDNRFYTANYTFFESAVPYFKKQDINPRRFLRKNNESSYFNLYTPDISVEMWGLAHLSHDNATFGEPFRLIPTQVFYHGYWVYAPHSPGTYIRNRYGPEVLKHSQSWRHVGLKHSYSSYTPGSFRRCKKPGHHACIDLFSGDGNLQFSVPN